MIHFNYQKPDDFAAFRLIKEGEGTFKVLEVKEKESRAGKQMLELLLRLTVENQSTLSIHRIMVNEQLAERIYRLLESANRIELYNETGMINPIDLIGLSGRCKVKTELSENPNYKDKSVVAWFLPYKANAQGEHVLNDDEPLPF